MSLGYIGDKFPYQTRQIALARFMSALMMGQIVGSTLGGIFGQYLGWRDIFIVFGIVALAVSILLAREGRRFPEPRKAVAAARAVDSRRAARRLGHFRRDAAVVLSTCVARRCEALGGVPPDLRAGRRSTAAC